MRYYIIENQIRDDGVINNIVTVRQTFATGLSYYYDRCSKMVVTELYPKVAIMLADEELNVVQHEIITTQWQQTTEEPEENE